MIIDKLKIRLKKFVLCLVASLVLMSSLSLSVSAEVTTYNYTDHTVYRYKNEPVTAYSLWLDDLGDLSYHLNKTTCYSFYLNDGFTISGVKRDSDDNITSLSLTFNNYEQKTFYEASSYTDVTVYPLSDSQRNSSYFSIYASSPDYCYVNWNKAVVSMASGIAEGETFTYYDPNGGQKTVTFDGEGGVVGFTDISGSTTLPSAPDMLDFTDINDYIGGITGSAPDYSDYNINLPDGDFETDNIVPAALRILLFIQQIPKLLNFFIDTVVYYLSNIKEILVALFQYINGNLVIAVMNIDSILKYIGELVTTGIHVTREILEKQFEFDFDLDLSGILDGISALKTITEETLKNTIATTITGFATTFNDIRSKIISFYDVFNEFVNSSIKDIAENISSIPGAIEDIKAYFVSLFDFSRVDIFERTQELREYIFFKFPILDSLSGFYDDISYFMTDSLANRTPPSIIFPTSSAFGGEDIVVSLGFLAPVVAVTDVIIVAACYILTLVYSIRAIPNILGGIGSGSAELYNSFSGASEPTSITPDYGSNKWNHLNWW